MGVGVIERADCACLYVCTYEDRKKKQRQDDVCCVNKTKKDCKQEKEIHLH